MTRDLPALLAMMKDLTALVASLSSLLWPLIFALIVVIFWRPLKKLLETAGEISVEVPGGKFLVKPSTPPRGDAASPLPPPAAADPLPLDYLFLNHTSFLRESHQEKFRSLTGVDLPHYDIRVIVDSYYEGALQQVDKVEYYLDKAFPEPIKVRVRLQDKFLLKELANGEFVLQAKIHLANRKAPILLQRYITLWKEGPHLG